MGRRRLAMEFISNEKKREVTFKNRKEGLLKKAYELSILCNVPICIIIYPYKEGDNQQFVLPQVYTFKGDEIKEPSTGKSTNCIDLARAMDPNLAREIIDRYLAYPKANEIDKRSLHLDDMLQYQKRKAEQELSKLKHKNARVTISNSNVEQLMELLHHLDHKLENVTRKIEIMKSNLISNEANYLVPSRMISNSDYNNNSHIGIQQSSTTFDRFAPYEPNYGMFVDHNIVGYNFAYHMNMMQPNYDQGHEIVGNNLIPYH